MSNTRRAEPGKPLKQERFASSPEFQRGLMANLVARRCELLDNAEDRELVWFIQYLSHQDGGLKTVAKTLHEKFENRIGTVSMWKFGFREGQVYDADKVRALRRDLLETAHHFPLCGEYEVGLMDLIADDSEWRENEIKKNAERHPVKYPAKVFWDLCRHEFSENSLENLLREMCLDPSVRLDGRWPWWFCEFANCIREYKTEWTAAREWETVTTAIGAKVKEAINYALEARCLVLIDGPARTGKSTAAKAVCAENSGRLRYVQVPSSNDEIGFLRAIAKSIGVSINLNSKAQELRQRIEETLQTGDVGIVFDEAHYIWPNLIDPRTVPARLNWILTALVNYGVPVALVTTPQFIKTQKLIESRTRWTSEQFDGRLGHYEALPDTLSEDDLEKVARAQLPEGDAKSIETLVCYAKSSSKYLAGIEHAVKRARFLARKDGREKASREDVKQAIKGSMIPSDAAFTKAVEAQSSQRLRSVKLALRGPLQSFNERSELPQADLSGTRSGTAPAPIQLDTRRATAPLVPS